MTIFLEPTFDAILKINNKDYILQKGNVLKISEIENDFVVFVFPQDTSKIPFSFVVQKDASSIVQNQNVQICPIEKNIFYLRLDFKDTKGQAKAQKLSNEFWIYENAEILKVKNKEGIDVLSTNFEKYKIDENGKLYIFKNTSKLLGCTLLQQYLADGKEFKLLTEQCVTQNKSEQSKTFDVQDLPFAFFESCKAHYFSYAMSLLSTNLSSATNKDSLSAFFEPYSQMQKNNFSKKGYFLIPNNQAKNLKLIDFVFDEHNKIDNIIEIL